MDPHIFVDPDPGSQNLADHPDPDLGFIEVSEWEGFIWFNMISRQCISGSIGSLGRIS